jgi:hypothetical protein
MPIQSEYAGTASSLGNSGGRLLERGRNVVADKIAAAAWSLEGRAEQLPGGERVARFAHGAADSLTCAADYIREHDANGMLEDVKLIVKNNPVPALVGAAALGFLLAKALSRD